MPTRREVVIKLGKNATILHMQNVDLTLYLYAALAFLPVWVKQERGHIWQQLDRRLSVALYLMAVRYYHDVNPDWFSRTNA